MATPLLISLPTPRPAFPPLVVPLADASNPAQCGNKAANLARLLAAGVAVPPGVVVSQTALRNVLDAGRLHEPIAGLWQGLGSMDHAQLATASDTLRSLILSTAVPAAVRQAIELGAAALGSGPLTVRSSAHGEDGASASFAGQLDSIADVRNRGDLIGAVLAVWASRFSHRALAYSSRTNITLDAMGVLVQRQVNACWSGVLFTEAPTGDGQMLLEFCSGMGEALVSGRANPGRVALDRSDGRWRLLAAPEQIPSTPPPLEGLLNAGTLASLARTALAIERLFGHPQDIEWAMDDTGRMWIVQARPVTTRARLSLAVPPAPAPASADDVPSVRWSNANVNENFPEPISPLLYSIARVGYYHYFRNLGRAFGFAPRRLDAMEQPLRHIVGVQGARLYYNLTNIHAVLRSAPFGDQLAASFNQFVGSESTATAAITPFAGGPRRRVGRALDIARMLIQITRQYTTVQERVTGFEARIDAFAARTHPSLLATRPLRMLLDDFRGFLAIRYHQWNDAALADAGSMVCYATLQRLLARAFPEDDQQALHNSLLKALPDLVSGRPALELWALAEQVRAEPALAHLFSTSTARAALAALTSDGRFERFRQSFEQFQEAWGFRCSGELMLTRPSFQEDAVPLIELLQTYVASAGESPVQVLARQTDARLAETLRVQRALATRRVVPVVPCILQRAVVMRVLAWTQTCICLRERARLKQALLYNRLRRILLEIGTRLSSDGRLQCADDIFFLTADEIDAQLAGCAMFPADVRALVTLRRTGHAALSAATPPDSLTLAEGEYFTGNQITPLVAPTASQPGLTGLGACGGRVTARAAVLADVRDAHRLRGGDVLVTRQTDPGWGPVFPLIAGLVVERGGMLSHGAIIAREFGIPSVVGVKDAMQRIAHGSVVTVDGDRGTIAITGEHVPAATAGAPR